MLLWQALGRTAWLQHALPGAAPLTNCCCAASTIPIAQTPRQRSFATSSTAHAAFERTAAPPATTSGGNRGAVASTSGTTASGMNFDRLRKAVDLDHGATYIDDDKLDKLLNPAFGCSEEQVTALRLLRRYNFAADKDTLQGSSILAKIIRIDEHKVRCSAKCGQASTCTPALFLSFIAAASAGVSSRRAPASRILMFVNQ